MFGITLPAINSAARTLAGYLAVWLVAKGFITAEDSELLVTAIVAVVGVAASMYFRRTNAIVGQAASLPEVKKIVAEPAVSQDVPSDKVVAR